MPDDDEEEEDALLDQAMEDFERQQGFQTQLLQQSSGGIHPKIPVGTFEFGLQSYVDRRSAKMGVRERHFTTRLLQTGNFVDSPHVVQALQNGLQRAMDRVLTTIPNLHNEDGLYFTLSSNRPTSIVNGCRLRAGERLAKQQRTI